MSRKIKRQFLLAASKDGIVKGREAGYEKGGKTNIAGEAAMLLPSQRASRNVSAVTRGLRGRFMLIYSNIKGNSSGEVVVFPG